MPRLNLNINLKAIPRDLIRFVGDAAYINLNVSELREADERGNDHTISVFVPQDRREEYPDKIYIGRGKYYPDNQRNQQQSNNAPSGDLPF